MRPRDDRHLGVLVARERGQFVAVGLQHALLAEGHTPDAAIGAFFRALRHQVAEDRWADREPLAAIHKAPAFLHDRWAHAGRVCTKIVGPFVVEVRHGRPTRGHV